MRVKDQRDKIFVNHSLKDREITRNDVDGDGQSRKGVLIAMTDGIGM